MSDFEFSTKTNWTLISSFIWGKVPACVGPAPGPVHWAWKRGKWHGCWSAVKLFATCQLCSVGGRWIVWYSLFSPNLHLGHSVLCKAAVSKHRNCLHLALFLETFWDVFSRLPGIFHFQRNYDSWTTTRLLSKVSGLKFFDTTRSWTRYYPTCFQALLHYLYLLHVKEFSYKFYIGKSFSVSCK